ncbi:VOC family protein [Aquibacillus kalidii]|uniref:VOC family protein n=1 Tax=Aquibacillus kalidii TaxID=2762597 RepID=UPI001644D308|nr:VOC family protein [Aquibacillus kalidii]
MAHSFHIKQIDLVITNLHKSIEFYTNVLGFQLLSKTASEARLGIADNTELIHLYENKEACRQGKQETGIYHFAILLPERKYLASFLKHVMASGYPLVGASDHLFSEAIYFQDPDNIGIEVYADRPRETWQYENGQLQAATLPLNAEDLLNATNEKWKGFPAKTIIGHLHFHVSSTKLARIFYVDKLGLDPMIEMGDQVLFVAGGGYHHHIGLNTWNGTSAVVPKHPVVGLKKVFVEITESDWLQIRARQIIDEQTDEAVDPFGVIYQISRRKP